MNPIRTLLFVAVAAFSCVMQIAGSLWGFPFDFALIALVAISFFASLPEVILAGAVSSLLLKWRPGFSLELLIILVLPVITNILRRLFPWRRWFSFVFFGIASIIVFNVIIAGYTGMSFNVLLGDIMISLSYGLILFSIFSGMYDQTKTDGFGFRRK